MKAKASCGNKQEAYVDPVHSLKKSRLGNDTPTCLTPPPNVRFTFDHVSQVSAAWCNRDCVRIARDRTYPQKIILVVAYNQRIRPTTISSCPILLRTLTLSLDLLEIRM
jgi:hypothetical protein